MDTSASRIWPFQYARAAIKASIAPPPGGAMNITAQHWFCAIGRYCVLQAISWAAQKRMVSGADRGQGDTAAHAGSRQSGHHHGIDDVDDAIGLHDVGNGDPGLVALAVL